MQSIDFASELAYTSLFALRSSTSIIAGFSRKNVLKISLFLPKFIPPVFTIVVIEYIFKGFEVVLLQSKKLRFLFCVL